MKKAKIIHLARGTWQLQTPDGKVSCKNIYDHPIVFNGYVAFTCYYGAEIVYKLGETIEHESLDHSLGK